MQPADLTPQVATRFGIALESGVLVTLVTDDSPAGQAGVEDGDVIVSADGEEVRIVEDLVVGVDRAARDFIRSLRALRRRGQS